MRIFVQFVVVLIVPSLGLQFHEHLNPQELLHYFGTPLQREVPDYELVGPVHLSGNRFRRATDHQVEPLEYHIRAFGEGYHVTLEHNSDLIAPGCLIHHAARNGTISVKPCAPGNDNCYYHGHAVTHNGSSAAFATCNGLHGVINTHAHDLLIQPVWDSHKRHLTRSKRDVRSADAHVVYKRQARVGACAATRLQVVEELSASELADDVGKLRVRRASPQRRYMEMMVVSDVEMFRFHGQSTETYALTAMNVASNRFRDSSLETDLRLTVVKVIILEDVQSGLEVTTDSEATLNSFCRWQEQFNPPADTDPQHADGAVLITRLNIHRRRNTIVTGLATISGMCQRMGRCSYNEDTGMELGFTVAHEIGHTLGMHHDGDGNGCTGSSNIMSASGGTGRNAFGWSTCSRDMLHNFLSTSRASCLDDQPSGGQSRTDTQERPGLIYNADDQCRFALGDGASVCLGSSLKIENDECARLVCHDPSVPGQCWAGTGPRLDGTQCDQSKWCVRGRCVDWGTSGPEAVDGRWSDWDSQWSTCSRSCGGGLIMRRRECNNPAAMFGGTDCQGDDVQAKLCNPQRCAISQYSFKEEQCTATNDHRIWSPFEGSRQPCALWCRVVGQPIRALRAKKYHDGTFCNADDTTAFARCLDGQCKNFGCDGLLDSGRVFDRCGVCNGQGDTCREITGTHTQGTYNVMVTFLTLPVGATQISMLNRNSYTPISIQVASHTLFNAGGQRATATGTYSEGGVVVWYRPLGPEKLTIEGPLQSAVHAQVFLTYDPAAYDSVMPDIEYAYYVPDSNVQNSPFLWKSTTGACSRTCGGGERAPDVTCVREDDGSRVDDQYCNIRSKPSQTGVPCNITPCPAQWSSGSFDACSRTCGGGLMRRAVECVRITGGVVEVVDNSNCAALQKPSDAAECNTEPCPGFWWTGAWSECSLTCGRGTKTRHVRCQKDETNAEQLDETKCLLHQKPLHVEGCVPIACSNAGMDGAGCVDVADNCAGYDPGTCTQYHEWALENCALTCGLCSADVGVTTGAPAVTDCQDVVDCGSYGDSVCTEFPQWSAENCMLHCNLCPTQQSIEECTDTETNCAQYGPNVCTEYLEFSRQSCRRHCNLCSGMTTTAITVAPTTGAPCQDAIDCSSYGKDACMDFKEWARATCPQHCGVCDCQDTVDCNEYDSDVCDAFKEWAAEHCVRHCGICGDNINKRRKRSASSELLHLLEVHHSKPAPDKLEKPADNRLQSPPRLSDIKRPRSQPQAGDSEPLSPQSQPQAGNSGPLSPYPQPDNNRRQLPPTAPQRQHKPLPIQHNSTKQTLPTPVAEIHMCNGLLREKHGRISTHNLPPDATCTLAISRQPYEAIKLKFNNIAIDCRKGEHLKVLESTSNNVHHFCAESNYLISDDHSWSLTVSDHNVLILLHVTQPKHGYQLEYSSEKTTEKHTQACSQQFNNNNGTLQWSGHSTSQCEYHINVQPNHRILIELTTLSMSLTEGCTGPHLTLIDLVNGEEDRYCGHHIEPFLWESIGSRIKVLFVPGSSTQYTIAEFEMTYHTVRLD